MGDRSYTVSPLLERNGYGRGAEVDLHTTNNLARILYLESRPPQPHFSEVGGSYAHTFTPWLSLQGNYLNREGTGHSYWTNGVAQSLYGIEPKLHFSEALNLDLEYALSDGNNRRGGSDQAVRVNLRGELFGDVHYAVEKVYAGPGFYGFYNDVDSFQGSVAFPIYHKLRGNLAITDYSYNLETNLLKSSIATRETTYRPGIRYTLASRTELQFDYQHIRRADILPPAAYDFTEDSLRLGVGHTFGRLTLQTFVEQGQLEDRLLHHSSDHLHRYSLYAYYRPSPRQTYSAYIRLGNSSFSSSREESHTYGASASWRLTDRLTLDVNGERNSFDSATGRQLDSARTGLSYTFPNQHNLALNARWTRNSLTRADETSVFVAYTIPFQLPISRKSSTGALKGRIFTQESANHQPLPRVILRLNDAWAVTDRKGEFIFPSLPPGKYQLSVDMASLGTNRVTLTPFPAAIVIKKGLPAFLEIGVVTAARLSVQLIVAPRTAANTSTNETIAVAQSPGSGLLTPASPFNTPCDGVQVDLVNGPELLRVYTDRDGRATFEHLRPGTWTYRIRQADLPDHHYVEIPEAKLDLLKGDQREVPMRVLARQRTIQFIDSGTLK